MEKEKNEKEINQECECPCNDSDKQSCEDKENCQCEECKEETNQDSEVKEDETVALKKEIEQLQLQITSLKSDVARAYADTDNIRKRLNSENEKANKYRIQSFALEILPALDNLERALSQPVSKENESLHKGMEMIYKQIKTALEKEGIQEIEAQDKPFDPNVHQSVMSEKVEGVQSDIVVEVLQKGYMLKDRLLRPSLVKISE